MKKFGVLLGMSVIALTATPAPAAPIYSQTTHNDSISSDADSQYRVADDFSLSSDHDVLSVTWRGIYWATQTTPSTDDFTILIYADNSGAPGAVLSSYAVGDAVSRSATGTTHHGSSVYEYSASLGSGFAATAGTSYWLSIVNNTAHDPDDNWFWMFEFPWPGPPMFAQSNDFGASFNAIIGAPYFILDGNPVETPNAPVPEPATLSLLGLGLAGAAVRRFRTRRAPARY